LKSFQDESRRALLWLGLGTALVVTAIDQVTKWLAIEKLASRVIEITSFFNLALGFNPGVTFGFLPARSLMGVVALVTLTIIIVTFLLVWMIKSEHRLERSAIGAVIGGAIGNLVDRVRQGAVTDFIDLHYAGWHWPTFNLADVGIVGGTAVLITAGFLRPREG